MTKTPQKDAIKIEAPRSAITLESNDTVQARSAPSAESVLDKGHPLGIVVETFVGVQRGINWHEKGQ